MFHLIQDFLVKILKDFISIICKFLIFVFGWQFLDPFIVKTLQENQKGLLIFPHTTYFDFFTFNVFRFAYQIDNLHTVVNEGIYRKHQKFFELLSCFPATAKERNNGGFVENTVSNFQNKLKYKILISPEGTLKKVPWRSGYWHIAKQLNIPIGVVGFDYLEHKMKLYMHYIDYEKEKQDKIQTQLRDDFAKIVPLYPESSDVEIYTESLPTLFDYCSITTIIFPLYLLAKMYFLNIYCFLYLCIAYISSTIYHRSHETQLCKVEPIIALTGLSYFLIQIYLKNLFILDFPSFLFLLLSFDFYILGTGRNQIKIRSANYIRYHSLFHIMISVFCGYQLI